MIEVEHLCKEYGDFIALQNLSFEVGRGEVIGMLGPNGAGKTTTMKILTCFLPQTSGRVRVAGFDTLENPLEVRRSLGYLPESNPLYPGMTVREFLDFIAELRGLDKQQRPTALGRMVEVCRLKQVFEKPLSKLSKGYRQRVGLAQAMVHDPDILILDEPTSGLDPNQIVDILAMIRDLGEDKTVIHSTHILSEAQETCHKVMVLSRGQLVAWDSPAELSSRANGHSMTLTLETDANPREILESVEGVGEVSVLGCALGFRFTLESVARRDLSLELSKLCFEKGWKVCELSYSPPDLDRVFSDLTRSAEDAA